MPNSELVTGWCVEWCANMSEQEVRNSFDLCGLVPREDYDVEKLHKPLRDIIKKHLSTAEWIAAHGDAVALEQASVGQDWIRFEGQSSFQRAVHNLIADKQQDFAEWRLQFGDEIVAILRSDDATVPIIAEDELAAIKEGIGFSDCFLEFYALATKLQTEVHVVLVDDVGLVQNRLEFGSQFHEIIAFYVQKSANRVYIPDDYDPTAFAVVEDEEPTQANSGSGESGDEASEVGEAHDEEPESADDSGLIAYEPEDDESFDSFMAENNLDGESMDTGPLQQLARSLGSTSGIQYGAVEALDEATLSA